MDFPFFLEVLLLFFGCRGFLICRWAGILQLYPFLQNPFILACVCMCWGQTLKDVWCSAVDALVVLALEMLFTKRESIDGPIRFDSQIRTNRLILANRFRVPKLNPFFANRALGGGGQKLHIAGLRRFAGIARAL